MPKNARLVPLLRVTTTQSRDRAHCRPVVYWHSALRD